MISCANFNPSALKRFLAIAIFSMVSSAAFAQVNIGLSMSQKLYLAGERVEAVITLQNMAGREIYLRGPKGQSWLGFDIRNSSGEAVMSPGGTEGLAENLSLAAGAIVKRKINLSATYVLDQPSDYAISAWVYFADLKNYSYSQRTRFTVSDAEPKWTQLVGVPMDKPGGGNYRRYELVTLQGLDEIRIYARLRSRQGDELFACTQLGRIVGAKNPQAAIDEQNRLYVLHQHRPQTYMLSGMDTSGNIFTQRVFRGLRNRPPKLVRLPEGGVGIRGGSEIKPEDITAQQRVANDPDVPRLSDRPE